MGIVAKVRKGINEVDMREGRRPKVGGMIGVKNSGGQVANSDNLKSDERRASLLECRVLSIASRGSCTRTGWRRIVIGLV